MIKGQSIYVLKFSIENKPGAIEEFSLNQECEVSRPNIPQKEIDAILNHFVNLYDCIIGEVYGVFILTKIS